MKAPKLEWDELAQAYCTERNSHKVLDPDLLEDICDKAQAIFEKWLEREFYKDLKVLGCSVEQIYEMKVFWEKHHLHLPMENPETDGC